MNNKVILTLSGGLDSATVLALAKKQKKDINVLTINYGQKNWKKELQCVEKLCELYDIKNLKILDFSWLGNLGGSAITDENLSLTSVEDTNIYVPFRNTLILSASVAWAEVINCNLIYTGSIDGNSEEICLDNTPKFYDAFNKLVEKATGKKIITIAPLIDLKKEEVLKLAIELGVPLQYTWSCVLSAIEPCYSCSPCIDRKEAFEFLNLQDPASNKIKEKKYEPIK